MYSLVIYVPSTHAEKMREALAISKAGAIGNYDSCSFTGAGTGRSVFRLLHSLMVLSELVSFLSQISTISKFIACYW